MLSHSPCHEVGNSRSSICRPPADGGGDFQSPSRYGSYTDIKSSSMFAHLRRGTLKFLLFECSYVRSYSSSRCRGTSRSWLRCIVVLVLSADTEVKAYTVAVQVYLSSQSTIRSVDEGAWTPYPENRIVGVNDENIPTACLSDPESMCRTIFPGFTTVREFTIHPSPLI